MTGRHVVAAFVIPPETSPEASPEASPGPDSFEALARDLAHLFGRGVGAPIASVEYDRWAARVFCWQVAHNEAYRGYCAGRGATAEDVSTWKDVPPVPTSAFRHLNLSSLEPDRSPEVVFRTSGTTGGTGRRGAHPVASLALYHASLLPAFRTHLAPEGGPLPVLALLPSVTDAPDSSLGHMVATVMSGLGAAGSVWLAGPDGALDEGRLIASLRAVEGERRPVLVVTTAFSLVHALDLLAHANVRVRLPEGSRLMETGGFKGRSRTVAREDLYGTVRERLDIPQERIVNEYGMTELLSQFYEPVLADPSLGRLPLAERFHVAPPWVRTRVLDPITLYPVAAGQPGLLCHHDLANAGSVACVLTEDMGVAQGVGFRLVGRAAGAEPRGCSLAVEELLRVAPVP